MTKNARDTRKCTARNAGTKKRCNRWAMKGQTVCCAHGGETAPAESDPFESVESLQAWVEAQKNRDGRVACMYGTPVDEHDGCRWCYADQAMRHFRMITTIRRNTRSEPWSFEDFAKYHGYDRWPGDGDRL